MISKNDLVLQYRPGPFAGTLEVEARLELSAKHIFDERLNDPTNRKAYERELDVKFMRYVYGELMDDVSRLRVETLNRMQTANATLADYKTVDDGFKELLKKMAG